MKPSSGMEGYNVVSVKKSLDIRIDVYKNFCYDGRRTMNMEAFINER